MNPHKLPVLFLLIFSFAVPLATLAAPDDNLSPSDFGLTEVGTLPTSPLYIFKKMRRGFTDTFTKDPSAKIDNSLRFAAERLFEAQALAKNGARADAVTNALNGFRQEVERARTRAEAVAKDVGGGEEGARVIRTLTDAISKYEKLVSGIEQSQTGDTASAATETRQALRTTQEQVLSHTETPLLPVVVPDTKPETPPRLQGEKTAPLSPTPVLQVPERAVKEKEVVPVEKRLTVPPDTRRESDKKDSENSATKEIANHWIQHTWRFADGEETSMILDRTDAEYRGYIKNTEIICRLMPKNQFLWRKGAGNDATDNWKNFGIPDCSGQAFAPANCGNNICESGETTAKCPKDCAGGKTAEDTYSCPGFANERIDSKGKRYCQLNARAACSNSFPQFLYEDSYTASLCPSGTNVVDDTTATSTRQFENCGSHTSRLGCEFRAACDWYVPTQGSAYCAPAVRNAWVSHAWRFSDGGTETSSILSRADREYSEFIASVDAQCKTITRNKFAWKPGAGNDAPDNWQNFGIPDCSGTATNTGTTGGTGSTICDSATTALLGTGCHSMGNAFFNSEMTKYVWPGGNTVLSCATGYVSGCSGSGGGGGTATTTGGGGGTGGGTSSMQKCFYPNASKNSVYVGYTVWCESDYVNCHKGSQSGEVISTIGVSLGAPSSCESGWTGGPSGSCNNNNYCDPWESKASCPVECANGQGTYTTGTCNNNSYCDPWESASSCPSECSGGSGRGGNTTCDSALTALLGTGCHQMYTDSSGNTIFCDGPMSKSAKRGDTTTTSGCTGPGGSGTGGGTGTTGIPTTPTGVTATASGSTVEIRWTDASTNETSFKIWRQSGGLWASLTSVPSSYNAATGAVITYSDQNVPSGSVNYQIQACNTTSCSSDSSVATTWVAGGGTTTTGTCGDRICSATESASSCPADCGSTTGGGGTTTGGGGSTTCDSALTALLGTGCHQMYTDSSGNTIFCDGPMSKSAKRGDTTTTSGCTGPGGTGSGGGTSCSANQYWNGSTCVTSTSSNSSCGDHVCSSSESYSSCPADCGGATGGGGSAACTGSQYWNGSACVTSSGSSGTTSSCPSGQYWNGTACMTSSPSCSSSQYWNGTSCVSSSGAAIWQAFTSWLKGE